MGNYNPTLKMNTSIDAISDGDCLQEWCHKVFRMGYDDYRTFTKKGNVMLFKRALVQRKIKNVSVPPIGPYLELKETLGIKKI